MPNYIGSYEVIKLLAKGGMGEVFLVRDPLCHRLVALKKIRPTLCQHPSICHRFLREAQVAAMLSHPSIISIYAIHRETHELYYTMPYIEGETLRQMVRRTLATGETSHPIPALIQIFLQVCQAVAFAHSKGILHRDLKPENIMVGKYGEVIILDWGVADVFAASAEASVEIEPEEAILTRPGKVLGTLAYMAPERALENSSSVQTDVYALGVILYQLLTLHLPFQRISLEQFRKDAAKERIIDPLEAAPYRDISPQLAHIALKCLAFTAEKRYPNVEELISDIRSYLEGRSDWLPAGRLHIDCIDDWAFQENVLPAKYAAITRGSDATQWASLMISKAAFDENIKIETRLRLGPNGDGIGLLLAIPSPSVRKGLEEGYCLWLATGGRSKLFRGNIEVLKLPDLQLPSQQWFTLCIEKRMQHLDVYFDEVLKIHYVSHLPLPGTHVGLLHRDADFSIEPLQLSIGSQNALVSCLAIPDSFLAVKDFPHALAEYRRIASAFAGRPEGREAFFRAGITLLEKGTREKLKQRRNRSLSEALDQFSALHNTPGAPLEYLGKSLVYRALGERDEELKCLELAVRKYAKHPLLPLLAEHIALRLHESATQSRVATMQFTLLALRHLPKFFEAADHAELLENLRRHLGELPFFPSPSDPAQIALQIAFWLAKPITLVEILEENHSCIDSALLCLFALGCHQAIRDHLHLLQQPKELETALLGPAKAIPALLEYPPSFLRDTLLSLLLQEAIDQGLCLDSLQATSSEALLWKGQWEQAALSISKCPLPAKIFFEGCLICARRGEAMAHAYFAEQAEQLAPSSWSWSIWSLIGRKQGEEREILPWEQIESLRQLTLFAHCAGDERRVSLLRKQLKRRKEI